MNNNVPEPEPEVDQHINPLPTHTTSGGLLPDNIRRRLPEGTVSVEEYSPSYFAVNIAGKKLRLPIRDEVNYIPTFANGWPTHDFEGNPLSNEVIIRLPFGAYNIWVWLDGNPDRPDVPTENMDTFDPPNTFVSFTDIDGNTRGFEL
jgi:hypothetical protein